MCVCVCVCVSELQAKHDRSVQGQLDKYLVELPSYTGTDAQEFWLQRQTMYSTLAPLALDLISAPASEAYVERIFSLCGMLTAGRRNRLIKSLEMRVFLKLNKHILWKQYYCRNNMWRIIMTTLWISLQDIIVTLSHWITNIIVKKKCTECYIPSRTETNIILQ